MFFSVTLVTALLASINSVSAAPAATAPSSSPSPNADLPPLVVGQRVPDEYLIRAGFNLETLYNGNHLNKRQTQSVCQTTSGSPVVYDVIQAYNNIPTNTGCGTEGGGCITMGTSNTGAVAICGPSGFNIACSQLPNYFAGIVSTCQWQGLVGGLQYLNEDAFISVTVFHT